MASAGRAKRAKESIRFLKTLPREYLRASTFNLALGVCAMGRDVDACLDVMDRLDKSSIAADMSHYTSAIAGARRARLAAAQLRPVVAQAQGGAGAGCGAGR
jgi:hypothetical protein